MIEEKKIIEDWEDESFEMLDSMEEKNNSRNKEVIDDAKAKVKSLFDEAREWIEENTAEEKIKENLIRTKDEANRIIGITRETVIEISENDNFKSTVANGKAFLLSTGHLINDGLKASRKQLEKKESIKNAFDKADEKIEELRNSEELKKAVDKAEATAKKVGDTVFASVRKFFNEGNSEEE